MMDEQGNKAVWMRNPMQDRIKESSRVFGKIRNLNKAVYRRDKGKLVGVKPPSERVARQ